MRTGDIFRIGLRIVGTIVLMSPAFSLAGASSDLNTSASKLNINSFKDFVAQLSSDGFGGIKLAQLSKALNDDETVSINQKDPDTGSQLSIDVNPAKKQAIITYYVEGDAYEKLGVDYASGALQLSGAALKIKQTQPLDSTDGAINSEESKDDQSMVGWRWKSGSFECRLAMSNAEVMGGDLIYECHN